MPIGDGIDFFLSRRGSVAAVAQEVAGALTEKGYKVVVQDYDIPFTANFVEAMHEAIKNARDLVILHTGEYEASPHTRKEFTSFEADRRCDDVPLRGLFATNVYLGPRRHRRSPGTQAAHLGGGRGPVTSAGTAAAPFCRRAAAHRQLHRT
jgi:hypothetical protein